MIVEYDKTSGELQVAAYTTALSGSFSERGMLNAYLEQAVKESPIEDNEREKIHAFVNQRFGGKQVFAQEMISPAETARVTLQSTDPVEHTPSSQPAQEISKTENQFLGKKYKPVALKVRPVLQTLPDKFRIKREILGDPLAELPELPTQPGSFEPTGRYTLERKLQFDDVHKEGFLWEEEMKLLHHVMMKQNEAFAWEDSEKGRFKEEFFPPVDIPIIEHTPWVLKNIPIPPGLHNEICRQVREKIDSGIIEPSNAPYRSRWFTVLKKNGKLRIVHSLEPLNAVTIAHSGVPPATEELAAHFSGRACGGMFDLFVGYDERLLAESSRDLTTFQTPYGAMRLVTLPMGWTNSVPIFHDDVNYILQEEVPEFTMPYIDDVPVRGPASRYQAEDGTYETIPDNPGIRRFIWEHMQNVNRVLQRMKYSGGTFSGFKSVLCAAEITVVGHLCSFEGRKPTPERIKVITNWGPCKTVSDVRAFLGTAGLLRIFIPNYGIRVKHIAKLLRDKVEWEWGPQQEESMRLIKEGLQVVPCLKSIDYDGQGAVVLAVDTSYRAVGYYIYQQDAEDEKKKYYARFGSIPLNDREARFSQPKRELFGLMRALHACRHWLIGVRKLIVETDASYIKGMLENPDLMPNATINRWIDNIKMFHFTIVHKAGATFGPDGLSRRPAYEGDDEYSNPDLDEEDPGGPPKVIIHDPSEPQPLDIAKFMHEIDNRTGFIQDLALDVTDFKREVEAAKAVTRREAQVLAAFLKNKRPGENKRVIPILSFLNERIVHNLLPDVEEKEDEGLAQAYPEDLRTPVGRRHDSLLDAVRIWLQDQSVRPPHCATEKEYKNFRRWAANFFVTKDGRLYRRGVESKHRLVVDAKHRMYMMKAAHDSLGHRGIYSTKNMLSERFWWPEMERDVVWYIKTCHYCQERQKTLVQIPPVETHTPSVFQVVHADTIHMTPKSNGCKYIVHARCHLTSWPEARALQKENAESIGRWLFEDIICRWGCLVEIVTDNGPPFIKAVKWLADKYGIRGIRISPYNSKANGSIERPHWDLRQMLYKATGGAITRWFWFLHHVLWADRISCRKRLGHSPFFMVTAAHPVIPLDVVEATWLIKLPGRVLTDAEVIGFRAQALAKHAALIDEMRERVSKAKIARLLHYEQDHKAVIRDFDFKPGSLVLVRNTGIESSLDKKMKPRYLGPVVVIRRSTGGSYVVAELNGALWGQKVAQFRVLPYFAREKIALPAKLLNWLAVAPETLQKLLEAEEPDDSVPGEVVDLSLSGVDDPVPDDELGASGDDN